MRKLSDSLSTVFSYIGHISNSLPINITGISIGKENSRGDVSYGAGLTYGFATGLIAGILLYHYYGSQRKNITNTGDLRSVDNANVGGDITLGDKHITASGGGIAVSGDVFGSISTLFNIKNPSSHNEICKASILYDIGILSIKFSLENNEKNYFELSKRLGSIKLEIPPLHEILSSNEHTATIVFSHFSIWCSRYHSLEHFLLLGFYVYTLFVFTIRPDLPRVVMPDFMKDPEKKIKNILEDILLINSDKVTYWMNSVQQSSFQLDMTKCSEEVKLMAINALSKPKKQTVELRK